MASFLAARSLLAATCLLALLSTLPSADALGLGLPDGTRCYYDKNKNPIAPFCRGNKFNCVVFSVPNEAVLIYSGVCNSTYHKGSFCQYQSIPYTVGTTAITANSLCQSCDCRYKASLPGANKGVCDCAPLPSCQVNWQGKAVGSFRCPPRQNMCVITKPGAGGVDAKGRPIDVGHCVFSGIRGLCGTAGPTWGPKFYAIGVSNVPKPGDRCTRCLCSTKGTLIACKPLLGCRQH